MKFARKTVFIVLGALLLCLPATAWAQPLDTDAAIQSIDEATQLPALESIPDLPTDQPDPINAPWLSKDTAQAGKELLISIGASSGIKLEPGAMYEVYLDDTLLGSYPADQNGQLFTQVTIPPKTPDSTHTLKLAIDNTENLQKKITIHR